MCVSSPWYIFQYKNKALSFSPLIVTVLALAEVIKGLINDSDGFSILSYKKEIPNPIFLCSWSVSNCQSPDIELFPVPTPTANWCGIFVELKYPTPTGLSTWASQSVNVAAVLWCIIEPAPLKFVPWLVEVILVVALWYSSGLKQWDLNGYHPWNTFEVPNLVESFIAYSPIAVSYTHLRAHET